MEMTDHEHAQIELCRRINRRAADQYQAKGVEPADIVIAAIYSAHDLASGLHDGNPVAAIEHLRTALDVMERQLLGDARALN